MGMIEAALVIIGAVVFALTYCWWVWFCLNYFKSSVVANVVGITPLLAVIWCALVWG